MCEPTQHYNYSDINIQIFCTECYAYVTHSVMLKMLNITQLHLLLRTHLMQHPLQYWFSADHHRHLIPAPNGYVCNVILHMSFHSIFQKEINRFF